MPPTRLICLAFYDVLLFSVGLHSKQLFTKRELIKIRQNKTNSCLNHTQKNSTLVEHDLIVDSGST